VNRIRQLASDKSGPNGSPHTLLCIHRDPARLSLLEENGYEFVTATNGYDGLQLFMSRCVDAIVLEYPLGVSNGSIITTEIKQVRPKLPVVILTMRTCPMPF